MRHWIIQSRAPEEVWVQSTDGEKFEIEVLKKSQKNRFFQKVSEIRKWVRNPLQITILHLQIYKFLCWRIRAGPHVTRRGPPLGVILLARDTFILKGAPLINDRGIKIRTYSKIWPFKYSLPIFES